MTGISFKQVPLIGALSLCDKGDHIAAARELLFSLLIAFLPILILLFIYQFWAMPVTVGTRLMQFANEGDLLLLSSAIVAPLCYMAIRNYWVGEREVSEFPHKYAFMIAYIVIVLMCTIAFVMIDFTNVEGSSIGPNNSFYQLSFVAVLVSVALIYLSTVYRNAMTQIPQRMTKSTEDFVSQWEDFNG